MPDPLEIIASNGDRWVGRESHDEDNCIVIEHYVCRDAGATVDEGMPPEDPTQDIHIPAQLLKDIAEHFED